MIWIVLSISAFKLFWGNIIVLGLFARQLRQSEGKLFANSSTVQDSIHRVQFFVYLMMFNNILAPFLSEAFTDPSCFYYVIQSPPSVSVTYNLEQCESYALVALQDVCIYYAYNQRQVSYTPPFIYSFQCSSTLLTAFATIFVYRYLFSGLIGPLGTYWIRWHKEELAKKMKTGKETPDIRRENAHIQNPMIEMTERSSSVNTVGNAPPKRIIETKAVEAPSKDNNLDIEDNIAVHYPDNNADQIVEKEAKKQQNRAKISSWSLLLDSISKYVWKYAGNDMVFNQESFVITMIGDMAVLLTFGLVFPPLALMICFSIAVNSLTHQVLFKRYLRQLLDGDQNSLSPASSRLWQKIIKQNVDDLLVLFWPAVPSLALLSACFVGFFLFDILGDEVGVLNGIWILVVTAAIPALVWIVEKATESKVMHK
jgi:hypothetical protein